eukprot:SAG31_NODE_7887_length_1573_cov_1.139756_2_plen_189_part_00
MSSCIGISWKCWSTAQTLRLPLLRFSSEDPLDAVRGKIRKLIRKHGGVHKSYHTLDTAALHSAAFINCRAYARMASRDRELYMPLYKRQEGVARELSNHREKGLSSVELTEITMLELRMELDNVMLCRSCVDAELEAEALKQVTANKRRHEQKKRLGVFASVFGSKSGEQDERQREFEFGGFPGLAHR